MKTQAERQLSKLNEVMEALDKYGYDTRKEVVVIRPVVEDDWDRVTVKLGGEPFGIYDFEKHTFVD